MDYHVSSYEGFVRELLILSFFQKLEVELSALDEVLGLADVHPESLEHLAVNDIVSGHGRENLSFDGGRLEGDPVNHLGGEQVKPGIYFV